VQVAAADIESPSVPKPQATINKQPLSARAQQQNMALRANASEAAGDTSGAIVIWQQIVSQQPAEANGYLNLARLWLKQQQIISASQVLLQARQNGVLSAEINMQLAQLAVRQGQWQQALEFLPDQFDLAIEPEYFGFKATVLQQLQQYGAALNWYQRLQQLQPDQGRWSLGAGLASEQLGQPLQANQYYQHAWQHRQALSVSSHNFIQQRLKATEP
jgi:tetratricopeptide (TPR) repeat protein